MREDMRNIMAWVKAARRNGLLENRCTEEWEGRRIHTESPLRTFSQEEIRHIILLNNHLKALTKEAKAKAERIRLDIQDRMDKGSKDYEDYNLEASIYVNPTPEQEERDDDTPFFEAILHCPSMDSVLFVDDDGYEGPIGRRWMELWTTYHITLCKAFAWFFDDQNVFPPSYMMRITPDNFQVRISIDI